MEHVITKKTLSIALAFMQVSMLCGRTFDEAVEQVYREKPHLRPAVRLQKNDISPEDNDSMLTWENIERALDIAACMSVMWEGYHMYHAICHQDDTPHPNPLVDMIIKNVIPTWLHVSGKYVTMGTQTAFLLFKTYMYRVLAGYALIGMRYGIIGPIRLITRAIRAICTSEIGRREDYYEDFS